jgi:hypothetical protein
MKIIQGLILIGSILLSGMLMKGCEWGRSKEFKVETNTVIPGPGMPGYDAELESMINCEDLMITIVGACDEDSFKNLICVKRHRLCNLMNALRSKCSLAIEKENFGIQPPCSIGS